MMKVAPRADEKGLELTCLLAQGTPEMVINYFTYAPALDEVWQGDPMSAEARAERRLHVHWVVDALLEKLARGG